MLIKALCDYYDILSEKGSALPVGYSKVNVHYLISLTEDGQVDEIIDCQETERVQSGKKIKEKKVPAEMVMPQRTEKPGIDANIAEHRPLYIFGLNLDKERLSPDDRTDKARKSHKAFVEKNLNFLMQEDESVVLMGLEYIMNTIQTVMFVRVVRLKKLVAIMRLVLR